MTKHTHPRTTDSLGRALDGHAVSEVDCWELDTDFPAPIPFPRDPGRPLTNTDECLSRAAQIFPRGCRWYCTRPGGHPLPHRASVSHDATVDYCVAEWDIPQDPPDEAGRQQFIDAINAGMRRTDDFGERVRAAVTRATGREGPIT